LFNSLVDISAQPLQILQAQRALDEAQFGDGTAVYDAIEQTCARKLSRLGSPETPRRVIFLISDGEDNASHVPHTDAELAAEVEGVTVFSLVTRPSLVESRGPLSAEGRGAQFLKELSRNTGGWTLSIVPSQSNDRKLHSLRIKSSQKGADLATPAYVFLR
jgi:hypothetical protein